jgi:hypothetical protein
MLILRVFLKRILNKMLKYFFFLKILFLYIFLKNQNQQSKVNKK